MTEENERKFIIEKTQSVCPVCNKVIEATIFERDGKVWIEKDCPEHGHFEDLYWGSYEMYVKARKWAHDGKGILNPNTQSEYCPFSCGLCPIHKSHTALLNIVVTNRCNLRCWYCFFYAERAGYIYEPTLEQIKEMLINAKSEKPVRCNAVQLTGGEPTLRDDLLDIIRLAKELGYDHVQVNTNGVKLAQDPELCKKIREAGSSTIYMSFDGVTKRTNPKNHEFVPKILENCRNGGPGIVLVPTVIKGVNDCELGDILKFAAQNIDIVRGVVYQPVSLVGSMPKKDIEKFRITIPDCIERIERQTNGEVTKDDWRPIPSVVPITHLIEALTGKPQYELTSHFACGMASYIFLGDDGKMVPIMRFVDVDGLLEYIDKLADEVRYTKLFKSRKIISALKKVDQFVNKDKQPKGFDFTKMLINIAKNRGNYDALGEFHRRTLFVGLMHFMDKYNYDVERVKRCVIHYGMPDGRIVPFCAFNVFPEIYRDAVQKRYGISIDEWERKTGRKLSDDFVKDVKPSEE